jgi:hypothetical protein
MSLNAEQPVDIRLLLILVSFNSHYSVPGLDGQSNIFIKMKKTKPNFKNFINNNY